MELNFFDYSDNKRYFLESNVVKYEWNSKPQYYLILGTETMKQLGVSMDFKSQDNNHWCNHLAYVSINHLQAKQQLN